jgi:UDP-N-acetylmuramate--alanine ligase
MNLCGNHNIVNSLAAIAVAVELGIDFKIIQKGLLQFKGVGRRLEKIGEEKGITVFDDYGHHPTEIRATLEALQSYRRRVVVVFQPHRYTRTELLWDDFGSAFPNADVVFLTEIYPAGEAPIEGVSSMLIKDAIKKHEGKEAEIISALKDIPEKILNVVREGDIVVTLGAGDINRAAPMIIDAIKERL